MTVAITSFEELTIKYNEQVDKVKLLEEKLVYYQQAYENLHNQLQDLLRHRFGKKSERHVDNESGQLSLFDDNFSVDESKPQTEDEVVTIAEHKRKKNKKTQPTIRVKLLLSLLLSKINIALVAVIKK